LLVLPLILLTLSGQAPATPIIATSGSTGVEFDSANNIFSWEITAPLGPITANVDLEDGFSTVLGSSTNPVGTFDLNGLGVGDFLLDVFAIDDGSGQSSSDSRSVTIVDDDVDAPDIDVLGPTGTVPFGPTYQLFWEITDATGLASSTIDIDIDGNEFFDDTSVSGVVEFQDVGQYTITIAASDADGDWAGDDLSAIWQGTVTVVPEPSTFLLVILSLLSLGMTHRRRRR
jgi:hypothetical protein